MPEFSYIARALDGQRVSGTLTAGTKREVLTSLAGRDLFPVQVAAVGKQAATTGGVHVKSKFVTPFYSQLAGLLRSGVPLLRSLQVLRDLASNKDLKALLDDVKSRVEDGATLAEAMGRHPRSFGELALSVIRAGGEGGFLEDALERVATFTDQQAELKSKVTGALAYPLILSIIGFLVVNGLIIFAVPMVEGLFARLKERGELPWITEALLALSRALQSYWYVFIGAIGLAIYGVRQWVESDLGRAQLDQWRIKVPVIGGIYLNLAVSRFCRVLGTLLKGGVPIVRSLDISADSTGNRVLSAAVREAGESITAGQSIAEPLGKSGHFPRDVVEMIAVAEQSNSLETVLTQVADSLEKSTWRKIELYVRLLEPLMLLLLAGVVLVVVVALLLPIIKISTTI